MGYKKHRAVSINNKSNKGLLIDSLLNGPVPNGFEGLQDLEGALFSKLTVQKYIEEEERHDQKVLTKDTPQRLKSMSSGEQKKALLRHLLKIRPDFLILDNPFDNLDKDSQEELKMALRDISQSITIVQLISRKDDMLPFITDFFSLEEDCIKSYGSREEFLGMEKAGTDHFNHPIPLPLTPIAFEREQLISLKNVSVSFCGKRILKNIDWEIKAGEFWQLAGKNGSGKTTLLSMITGDNPKGYGQELFIFGQKKGSGESIWDIKKKIGYFTPAMIDRFSGYHTVEHMLISGLMDSIGLYVKPTEAQLRLAKEWLQVIGMQEKRNTYFHDLTMGQQRLVMAARAMIKHPLLLILDEPTASLDDDAAYLFVCLVNKIAQESDTAIIFVSHRKEEGLRPDLVYELKMMDDGSIGCIRH